MHGTDSLPSFETPASRAPRDEVEIFSQVPSRAMKAERYVFELQAGRPSLAQSPNIAFAMMFF
jgi:hypothetical protein